EHRQDKRENEEERTCRPLQECLPTHCPDRDPTERATCHRNERPKAFHRLMPQRPTVPPTISIRRSPDSYSDAKDSRVAAQRRSGGLSLTSRKDFPGSSTSGPEIL